MRTQAARRKLPGVRKTDDTQDRIRRRAEAAAHEAVALRQKQTGEDLNAAVTLFQKSAHLFKTAQLNDRAAEAKLQAGEIYSTLSQYDKALSSYQQARNLGGKAPEVLCVALSRIARIYATTGQNVEADDYSNQAVNQCGALANPELQAESLEARGEALLNSGKLPQSAEFFSRAHDLFKEADDKSGQAQALLMAAYAHFQDDRAAGLHFAGEALQLWSSIGDLHGVAETHAELGIFAVTTDEFETAKCNYDLSLPVFHSLGDKDSEAAVLNGMGNANNGTGDVEAALENFQRAEALFSGVGDRTGAAGTITGMGKALTATQRYQALLLLYARKLRLAQQTKNATMEASALADLGGVYELRRQYAKAEALYRRSLEAYTSAKRDYGIADNLVRLALLHAKQGEHLQAVANLERALGLKDKTGQIEDVARINYELANLYRRLNRLEDALAAIQQTIGIIESQRVKIANFDSRAAYFSSVHQYYALYIQILMLIDQLEPERGLRKVAFEASEKSKVRALLDLLSASKEDSPCDELLRRQLAPPDSTGTRAPEEASTSPVLKLEQIQAEIGDEDTVLEFALGDEKSYVWVVDQTQFTVHELPQAGQIEKLAHAFHDLFTAREPRAHENSLDEYKQRVRNADLAYPEVARQLARLLLGPLNLSGTKRLLIVADGFLQYIPFSALPLAQAGQQAVPLIRNHELVVLPSASALGTLRKAAEKRTPPTRTAVIVADPVVDDDDPRLQQPHNLMARKSQGHLGSYAKQSSTMRAALRDTQGSLRVTRLKGAGVEAEAIRQILGPREALVKLGFSASRDFVLQGALAPYRIIHFATHGMIDARRPEMSGLVLSLINRKGQAQDGYLRLGDIYKLKLSADLVVLSACDSALGKNLASEGMIGLPRGFLYAGSRSVIASLWKVDDDAAAAFMKSFYARIQKHEGPSSALRGAQLDMSRGKQWREPFYWAAFVLQGDYK